MTRPTLSSPKLEPSSPTSSFRASLSGFSYAGATTSGPRRSPRNHAPTSHPSSLSAGTPSTPKRTLDAVKAEGLETVSSSKRRRKGSPVKRGYASPEKYAHLRPIHDYLAMGLDVMFCGINPGVMSAETGHHFANPTNHFWRALHQGGLVPQFVPPSEDHTLPEKYNLGMTNLVERPSVEAAELSAKEMLESVPAFLAKVAKWRPRMVCFVGKGIWLAVQKNLDARPPVVSDTTAVSEVKEAVDEDTAGTATKTEPSTPKKAKMKDTFEYGIQPYVLVLPPEEAPLRAEAGSEVDTDFDANSSMSIVKRETAKDLISFRTGIDQTLLWVMPSTSGRVVSHQLVDKIKLFAQLKEDCEAVKASRLDISRFTKIQI